MANEIKRLDKVLAEHKGHTFAYGVLADDLRAVLDLLDRSTELADAVAFEVDDPRLVDMAYVLSEKISAARMTGGFER